MRNKTVVLFLTAIFVAIALSGCGRPRAWLATDSADVRTFYFGETGAAKITVSGSLKIGDHPSSLLPTILTEAFQERLDARGLTAGEAKPSPIGALDEFKMDGRKLILEVYWANMGVLLVTGGYYQEGRTIAHLHVWENMPAVPSQYYKDDESFYHGLKNDIGPIIDKALDDILKDFAAQGLARP